MSETQNKNLISGKTGGDFKAQKSNYAKKVEIKEGRDDKGSFQRNTRRYNNDGKNGFEEFIISPIPNDEGKVEDATLSYQAQEFLASNKNRIQINNQVNDIESINLVPDEEINYKNIDFLKKHMSQFGQISSMYSLGLKVKSKKKRLLSNAIKKARFLGLISYPDQIV